jgi:hypothetical protein
MVHNTGPDMSNEFRRMTLSKAEAMMIENIFDTERDKALLLLLLKF